MFDEGSIAYYFQEDEVYYGRGPLCRWMMISFVKQVSETGKWASAIAISEQPRVVVNTTGCKAFSCGMQIQKSLRIPYLFQWPTRSQLLWNMFFLMVYDLKE